MIPAAWPSPSPSVVYRNSGASLTACVVPPEHVAVERDRRVVVAGVQLEPRRRAGLGDDAEARALAGCQMPIAGPARVGHHGHRARAPCTCIGGTNTWPPCARRRVDGRLDVVGREVDRPARRAGPVVPSLPMKPGDRHVVLDEVLVAAVVGARVVDLPAEERRVERPGSRPGRRSRGRSSRGHRRGRSRAWAWEAPSGGSVRVRQSRSVGDWTGTHRSIAEHHRWSTAGSEAREDDGEAANSGGHRVGVGDGRGDARPGSRPTVSGSSAWTSATRTSSPTSGPPTGRSARDRRRSTELTGGVDRRPGHLGRDRRASPTRAGSLLASVNYFGSVALLEGLRPLLARGDRPGGGRDQLELDDLPAGRPDGRRRALPGRRRARRPGRGRRRRRDGDLPGDQDRDRLVGAPPRADATTGPGPGITLNVVAPGRGRDPAAAGDPGGRDDRPVHRHVPDPGRAQGRPPTSSPRSCSSCSGPTRASSAARWCSSTAGPTRSCARTTSRCRWGGGVARRRQATSGWISPVQAGQRVTPSPGSR